MTNDVNNLGGMLFFQRNGLNLRSRETKNSIKFAWVLPSSLKAVELHKQDNYLSIWINDILNFAIFYLWRKDCHSGTGTVNQCAIDFRIMPINYCWEYGFLSWLVRKITWLLLTSTRRRSLVTIGQIYTIR